MEETRDPPHLTDELLNNVQARLPQEHVEEY
jgi:hypothetical protein